MAKEFRSVEEVENSSLDAEAKSAARGIMKRFVDAYDGTYDPDDYGWLVHLDAGDDDDAVRAALGGYSYENAPWEGGIREGVLLASAILWDNESGLSVSIDPRGMPPEKVAAIERALGLDGDG